MAVFYVLPPRPAMGECLARLLRPFLPGVAIAGDSCTQMVETIVGESTQADEAYVVHREDLPDCADVKTALCHGYGAEPGDRIVLVSLGAQLNEPTVRISHVAA